MGICVRELYRLTERTYHLQLLAGESGLDYDVRWMYFIEDYEVTDYIYGNELVITTGCSCKNADDLFHIVKGLCENHACGLILNVGRYINQVSEELLAYCDENAFPLFTMPWEIHIVDIVKDYCTRIFNSEQNEQQISAAFQRLMFGEQNVSSNDLQARQYLLDAGFKEETSLVVCMVQMHLPKMEEKEYSLTMENIKLVMSDQWNHAFSHYNVIAKGEVYLVVIQTEELDTIEQIWHNIELRLETRGYKEAHIGIGSKLKGFQNLGNNYSRASAALFMAKIKSSRVMRFDDMGIYRVLLTSNNWDILEEMYYEALHPLLAYDEEHNTELTKTMRLYLQNQCSIQAVSEVSFVHRNTINYRIHKIKELLHSELENSEELFHYQFVFYVENILHWRQQLEELV